MKLDLTDEQQTALATYLRTKLDAERYRYDPALRPIKEVLAMLDPPKPRVEMPEIPSAPKRGKTKQRR